jgi:hypothetical protein
VRRLLRGCRLITLPGFAHVDTLMQAEIILPDVKRFLSRVA